jgi:hypothetical protein
MIEESILAAGLNATGQKRSRKRAWLFVARHTKMAGLFIQSGALL